MRTRILRAAGKQFAAKGYEATTMQNIVAEARTSIGNVYFYFENKEALMRALLETSLAEMFDAAERRVAHITDGPLKVGAMIASNATALLTARVRMLDLLTADSRLSMLQRLGDIVVARWTPVLVAAYPDRDPQELSFAAAAIWGANRSLVERAARGAFAADVRDVVAFMVRWTLRALGTPPSRIESIVTSAWRIGVRHARELELQPW
jgi:AcrR family transcriptional regulator